MSVIMNLTTVPPVDRSDRFGLPAHRIFFADLMDHGAWYFPQSSERPRAAPALSLTIDPSAPNQERP